MRLLCLFLFFPFLLLAQPARRTAEGWQELTISDGLSQGMIFDLKQDQDGFIWAATKDGLNRYDGHNFTAFTHDPYNEYSISDNACSALLVDSRGRLWVGTLTQGLNLFDSRTQRFYHIDISDQDLPNAGSYEIRLLAGDPDGNIWVSTDQNRLFRISLPDALKTGFPDSTQFTAQVQTKRILLPYVNANGTTHQFSFQSDGTATVGTNFGQFTFNWRQVSAARPVDHPANRLSMYSISTDGTQSGYWFSVAIVYRYIHCWYRGKHKAIRLPKNSGATLIPRFIGPNTVAVATTDYLWLMSPAELLAQDSLTARNAVAVLPPNITTLRTLVKDQTGMLWIGTAGYGLRTFNPKIRQFRNYLPTISINYLYQDRQQRLYALDYNRYRELDQPVNRTDPFMVVNEHEQRYLVQDRRGDFWVAYHNVSTDQHYLYAYSSERKVKKIHSLPAGTGFGYYGNQILEASDGTLWIGSTKGKLLRFDPVTGLFRVYSYGHLLPQSGADTETYALYFDGSGTGWIGTQKGLIRVDNPLTKPVFSIYKNSKSDRNSLSNNFVSCILDDPNQPARYLWVSTKGGGLERLDKQTRAAGAGPGRFTHFTEARGLPNNVVYGMLADEFKNLWLSTNRGLAQFNPKTFAFRNYTRADGLQDDEFNTGSFLKTASGELLFGGVNGLTAFRAREVSGKQGAAPHVHIVSLKINNELVKVGGADGILAQAIENTGQIDLTHNQNGLTLEFAVMDYTNSAKNRYRYRLNGIDKEWVEAGTNRFANYAQLPSGNYQLDMTGSTDGDVWSTPVQLVIRIHPPFYQTWWAMLIYALVLAVIGWQLYGFQKQRWLLEQQVDFEQKERSLLQQQVDFDQKEASRLAELDALKTQFFANISHEFRTPLTLILGPIEQAMQEYAHDTRFPLIQRNANRLLSLINQLLDLSKLEVGELRVETEPGDIAMFFQMLASSFDSLAESRQIRFTFTQNEGARQALFDRDKLEKIVTNLLANAFKFTPAGNQVSMTVCYPGIGQPGMLQCSIEDTGIGIAPQHLAHIFERFYQGSVFTRSVCRITADAVEGQTNRDGGDAAYRLRPYEGTGIGLALVHELVKVQQGTINVVSTEGVGTTFIVTLPLPDALSVSPTDNASGNGRGFSLIATATASAVAEQTIASDGLSPTSENILLIVDDNADIRAYVRSVFEDDYHIIEAVDGQDGLDKATASLPNVVICDLMMPRLDGFGFCKALKSGEATSHIPVVMLTAKATVEDRIEGFELGADDYLTKPFNRAEIQARVRNLIEQRQRLYQRFARAMPETPTTPEQTQPTPDRRLAGEQQFLNRVTAVVLAQLDNTDLSVEGLAETLTMSRVQLHRKLKALTNSTPTDFIRNIRLAGAIQLLQAGDQSVTQVAYAVGFDNLSYFAKAFQERYGVLPSQWGKKPTPSV